VNINAKNIVYKRCHEQCKTVKICQLVRFVMYCIAAVSA